MKHVLKSILLACGVADEKLSRYVVAYGGDVVPAYRADEATHIFYAKKRSARVKGAGSKTKHLEASYLVDSLKLRKAQDVEGYVVQ